MLNALAAAVGVPLAIAIAAFMLAIPLTVFQDHQDLVGSNRKLISDIVHKEATITQLKRDVENAKKVHLTAMVYGPFLKVFHDHVSDLAARGKNECL